MSPFVVYNGMGGAGPTGWPLDKPSHEYGTQQGGDVCRGGLPALLGAHVHIRAQPEVVGNQVWGFVGCFADSAVVDGWEMGCMCLWVAQGQPWMVTWVQSHGVKSGTRKLWD